MPRSDLHTLWLDAGVDVFDELAEPVTFRRMPARVVVDDLPYGTVMRGEGGGLAEEFSGNVVFLKADFPALNYPKNGETVVFPSRTIRLREIEGVSDHLDPFITAAYEPVPK